MKKILSILLVHRSETDNKWWHRLVSVFIFGTTILVAIFAISLFVSNSEMWKKYSYTAFSFESNYSVAKGKEVTCSYDYLFEKISCGEYTGEKGVYEVKYEVNISDFTKRYNKVVKDGIGQSVIDKICADGKILQRNRDNLGIDGLDSKMLSCMALTIDVNPIRINYFPSNLNNQRITYSEYLTDKQVNFIYGLGLDIKAKMTTSIVYPVLFLNLLYLVLTILGWFIFWESIIYRTLLYIIYGKKKSIG